MALAQAIPPGTVLPVQVNTGLKADTGLAGKKIEGRVMQDVPLPENDKIKEGARITGRVVRVTKKGPQGASIVVEFNAIDDGSRSIHVTTALVAVASPLSVQDAQLPVGSTSNLDPTTQWTTRQVGGDIVRRGWGEAGPARDGVRGKWIKGSAVVIRLTPNAEAGCPGGLGYEQEQPVWVFSSGACGAYGLPDLKITNPGSSAPLGEIVLKSTGNINIRSGSGWLLMVVGGGPM